MSLAAMLAAHDAAALAALASPGLVRRAEKDAAAGKARVLSRGADAAVVAADGQEVTVPAAGPRAATCPCPATGLCRHILLAVLALRAEAPAQAGPSARDELAALDAAAVATFAGADLAAALALAGDSDPAAMAQDGGSLVVTLAERPDTVTFIPGQGLDGAAYKGPKSRRRVMVAAAALLARRAAGVALPEAGTGAEPALSGADLDRVTAELEASVRRVLTGTAEIAGDRLHDLAIAARAQAAPRLTGLLRGLGVQAMRAARHDVRFDEGRFLTDAGRAAALVAALRAAPGDPALTGVIRRAYAEAAPFRLWIAGAVHWTTPQGARGLRLHGIDPETGAWRSGGPARAAGQDPQFRVRLAWAQPLWGAGQACALPGKCLAFDAPLLAADGVLSTGSAARVAAGEAARCWADIEALGAVLGDWAALRADVARRLGGGLRAAALPVPVLLRPRDRGRPVFDDLNQRYLLALLDGAGRRLDLVFDAADDGPARYLHDHMAAGDALLCEAAADDDRMALRAVSLIRRDLATVNLSLDALPRKAGALSRLRQHLPGRGGGAPAPSGAMMALSDAALDAAVAAVAYRDGAALARVAAQAGAAGLEHLRRAAARAADSHAPGDVLRLAYLAAEVRRLAALAG